MTNHQTRILYTWHGVDYTTIRYAFPDELIRVSWCINRGKGYPNEASGSTLVQASDVQDWVERHERASVAALIVESIQSV